MTAELSIKHARLLRLGAQGLAGEDRSEATVDDIVRGCCGLQAQDARWAPLAIRARSQEVTASNVRRARFEDRSVVRTWCMRGTSHFVPTGDLSWLLSLFGPLYVDRGSRRLDDLGFDEDDAERAVAVVRDALAEEGPLSRDEIADRLLAEGYEFDPGGQAPIHVVRRACLEGVAIEAEPRDGTETYAALDDWVSPDPSPDRETALADLTRRYAAAYEPVTLDDFHSWSGLYKRDVRTGWEAIQDELTEVVIAGERQWIVSDPDAVESIDAPTVRLLPMYDSYFLGHENRDLVLPEEHADRVYPGGGIIRATVVVDGLAAGTWRLDRSRKTAVVRVEPFDPLDDATAAAVETEATNIGHFLDTDVSLELESG